MFDVDETYKSFRILKTVKFVTVRNGYTLTLADHGGPKIPARHLSVRTRKTLIAAEVVVWRQWRQIFNTIAYDNPATPKLTI